jgi:diguanylate cyclase (GGDEF)-like protein/PAS domain S-box-containing protein
MKSAHVSLGLLFPALRISLTLTLLTGCMLFGAEFLGFTPRNVDFLLDARKKISESMAIQFSLLDPVKEINKIKKLTNYVVQFNPEILSAGIRHKSGMLIFESIGHSNFWNNTDSQTINATQISVPIKKDSHLWGNVEFRFSKIDSYFYLGLFENSMFKTFSFLMVVGFFTYLIFMLRILRELDPSAVVPDRINAAFDALSEGVIIMDINEQILLTNKAFSRIIRREEGALIGTKMSELPWVKLSQEKVDKIPPWTQVLNNNESSVGAHLVLESTSGTDVKLVVNASPVSAQGDKAQGVLITLDDITQLERRNEKLQSTVQQLKKTQFQVKEKNKELTYLAAHDPLTGCLNRRSFSERFELQFVAAKKLNTELSCIMVDLDYFKLVNDNYGHSTGDEVIKLLANILKSCTREEDLVGRYGGEEFCLVLLGMTAAEAVFVSERIRLQVKTESVAQFENGPAVAASLGVASIKDNSQNTNDLINKADEALYIAKESGRDQVFRWRPGSAEEINKKSHLATKNESDLKKDLPDDQKGIPNVIDLKNRVTELESIAAQFSSELQQSKNYDNLTKLPSQKRFYAKIKKIIDGGHSGDNFSALLIIDIEMFRQINTTLGRNVGDQLLQVVAKRLLNIVRKPEQVSRLNGDEFSILLTDLSQKDQVVWAVKRLQNSIGQLVVIDGNTIQVSCHVGISLYPSDKGTPEELLNSAMTAKNYSKKYELELGYHFYNSHMQTLSVKHLLLNKELHQAIKNEEWQLYYQPKLDIHQQKITGVEALIRWNHPQRGLLMPSEFIGFAEQRGLIIAIGDWVIRQACQQLKSWINDSVLYCKIAINLSAVQLSQKDIAHKILSTLDYYGVPAELFEIEITETALINNIEVATESLYKLASKGVSIAIADFGVGYSSLDYLKRFPIRKIKIDRAFIKNICENYNDQKIIEPLISMGHSMGLSVIAEGVETQSQYDLLKKYRCDEIQGFFLSNPVSVDELESVIASKKYLSLGGALHT